MYQQQHMTHLPCYIPFHRRALRRARRLFACSSTTRYDTDAIRAVCIHPAASIPKAAQHSNAIGDPAFNTGKRSATDSLPRWDEESRRLQRRSTCGWTSRRTNRSARPTRLDGTTSSGEEVTVSFIAARGNVRSELCCAACTFKRLEEVLFSVAAAPPASCRIYGSTGIIISTRRGTWGVKQTAEKKQDDFAVISAANQLVCRSGREEEACRGEMTNELIAECCGLRRRYKKQQNGPAESTICKDARALQHDPSTKFHTLWGFCSPWKQVQHAIFAGHRAIHKDLERCWPRKRVARCSRI